MLKKVLFICIAGVSASYSLWAESIIDHDSRPKWLKPKRCRPERKNHEKTWSNGITDARGMQYAAGKLLYLIDRYDKSPIRPYYMYKLGWHLVELDEPEAALVVLEAIQKLPDKTPYEWKDRLTDIGKLKRAAKFLQMRAAAKMAGKNAARSIARSLKPVNGYENLLMAESYLIMGESAKAEEYLKLSHGDGHPDKKYSDVLIRMYAATMARTINNDKLALEILNPVIEHGYGYKKGKQWQRAFRVLQQLKKNVETGRVSPDFKYSYYRKGTFQSRCDGFDSDIVMGLYFGKQMIQRGPIQKMKNLPSSKKDPILDKVEWLRVDVDRIRDSRPWCSAKVIPKRMLKMKSTAVDAVTGATITSCAIIIAAEEARRRANITKKEYDAMSAKSKKALGYEKHSRLHFHD